MRAPPPSASTTDCPRIETGVEEVPNIENRERIEYRSREIEENLPGVERIGIARVSPWHGEIGGAAGAVNIAENR